MARVALWALLLPLIVLGYLAVAFFHLFVWLTHFAFFLIGGLTGRMPPTGAVVLSSAVFWCGIALLFLPWVQLLLPINVALGVLAVIGSIWGLCIGGRVAMGWEMERLRWPNTNPRTQFGLPNYFFSGSSSRRAPERKDREGTGIFLGEMGEDREP